MATIPLTEQDVADHVVILNLQNVAFSDEQFIELCADNRDFRFELTAQKELVIMTLPPSGTGRRNGRIYYCLEEWAREKGTGPTFPPGVLFQLPNGAKRGPDVSWVRAEVWESLSHEDKEKISPLSPDFVVELMSLSDRRPVRFRMLQAKMHEYIANGVRLGWMIDPFQKKVTSIGRNSRLNASIIPKRSPVIPFCPVLSSILPRSGTSSGTLIRTDDAFAYALSSQYSL